MRESIEVIANEQFRVNFSNQREVLEWLQKLFSCAATSHVLRIPHGPAIAAKISSHWTNLNPGAIFTRAPRGGGRRLTGWLLSVSVSLLRGQYEESRATEVYRSVAQKIGRYLSSL